MSSNNPSAILAESFAEFSKSAHKAFTEIETQARQEVSVALVEIRELRAERDKAIKDLHAAELVCQSWKQEASASKAASIQAELTITHQAESLAKQVETIAQLRREVNQWKDQSRNWQEHFLRAEQERCAHSSRIDEIIVDKLHQYAHPLNTSSPLITQKTSKYTNHVNSSTSAAQNDFPSVQSPDIQHGSHFVAHHHAPQSPQARAALSAPSVDSSASVLLSGSRQHKQNPQAPQNQDREKERQRQPDGSRQSTGKKIRNSNGSSNPNRYTEPVAVAPQHQPQALTPPRSVNPDVPCQRTVIRRVQAVVHVKREEDETDEDAVALHASSSSGSGSAVGVNQVRKRKKEDPVAVDAHLNRRRRGNRKSTAIFSDEDDGAGGEKGGPVGDDGEVAGRGDVVYKLRRPPKVDYREEPDEEEDELMMGAEDNHDEVYGTHPVDPSRQPVVESPKKRRRFSAR